jgi:hypothetical protein
VSLGRDRYKLVANKQQLYLPIEERHQRSEPLTCLATQCASLPRDTPCCAKLQEVQRGRKCSHTVQRNNAQDKGHNITCAMRYCTTADKPSFTTISVDPGRSSSVLRRRQAVRQAVHSREIQSRQSLRGFRQELAVKHTRHLQG